MVQCRTSVDCRSQKTNVIFFCFSFKQPINKQQLFQFSSVHNVMLPHAFGKAIIILSLQTHIGCIGQNTRFALLMKEGGKERAF